MYIRVSIFEREVAPSHIHHVHVQTPIWRTPFSFFTSGNLPMDKASEGVTSTIVRALG